MSDKSKNKKFWLTSLMIGTAVASVAGALYVAKDKEKGGKFKAIKKIVLDVLNDGKTIYKSLTVDNVKQVNKIKDIIGFIAKNTWNKLNIANYFNKRNDNIKDKDLVNTNDNVNLIETNNNVEKNDSHLINENINEDKEAEIKNEKAN